MNEQDLRHALHGAMRKTQAPPSMNGTEVLGLARKAHRRRQARLAGAGTAVAVAVIAAGAMFVPSIGASGPVLPGVSVTQTPDKTSEKTQVQGPNKNKSVALMETLISSAPEGFETPDNLEPVIAANGPVRTNQAHPTEGANGNEGWAYSVDMPIGFDNRWGRMNIEVHPPSNNR
ncbi:MAG: hypothetical protein M3443_08290, partial [Actinomycetota bacterium]|nr:hypothetical protein [Actinomycetota bacterium]